MPLFRPFLATLAFVAASTAAHSQTAASTFGVNGLDSVQTGGNTQQFVELFNGTGLNIDFNLTLFTLAFYNGTAGGDSLYMPIPLTDMLAAGGYYVVGNSTITNRQLTFADGALETGANAVILFNGATPPNVPNLAMILRFIDAIVYGQDQPADLNLLTLTGEAPFQYNENFGASAGSRGAGTASLSRVNGVDAEPFGIGISTPGAANQLLLSGTPAVLLIPEPTPLAIVGLATTIGVLFHRRRL